MANPDRMAYLLDATKRVMAYQRQLAELRGETFNVFSILKMERLENDTHSAFITELLNPKGSHLKGNVFLRLFLECLNGVPVALDLETAWVKPEHHVGVRDVKSKTGGRIDIYISDKFGNCIAVENKIDAGDQEAQIERYCNHNKGRNIVLYLTLHGIEPSKGSKGALESGTDFYTISYRDHILAWLDKCAKEAVDAPILRETIKQYKILIQKLTVTMAEKETQELAKLMFSHFNEAEYIVANFNRIKVEVREQVRLRVMEKLAEKIGDSYTITSGYDAAARHSNFWVKPNVTKGRPMYFGIEGFSGLGHFGGALFVGVFNEGGEANRAAPYIEKFSDWWVKTMIIPGYNGPHDVNPNDSGVLQKLHSDEVFREHYTEHITTQIVAYLEEETEPLRQYLQTV